MYEAITPFLAHIFFFRSYQQPFQSTQIFNFTRDKARRRTHCIRCLGGRQGGQSINMSKHEDDGTAICMDGMDGFLHLLRPLPSHFHLLVGYIV